MDDDIESDMLLIADDFLSWLQNQDGFELVKSSQILKITDEYGDRISGIRFRITLSIVRRQDECSTPVVNEAP